MKTVKRSVSIRGYKCWVTVAAFILEKSDGSVEDTGRFTAFFNFQDSSLLLGEQVRSSTGALQIFESENSALDAAKKSAEHFLASLGK